MNSTKLSMYFLDGNWPNLKIGTCLVQDRAITTSAEWRKQIQEVDQSVFTHLRQKVEGGFDEEQFSPRISFSNLKR